MIDRDGPRVVEFNCRFGDPECQVVMPRLADDLLPLLAAAARGEGLPAALAWKPDAAVCVVLTSAGYPGRYETGLPITGVEAAAALPASRSFPPAPASPQAPPPPQAGRVLGCTRGATNCGRADTAYAARDRISQRQASPPRHSWRRSPGQPFTRGRRHPDGTGLDAAAAVPRRRHRGRPTRALGWARRPSPEAVARVFAQGRGSPTRVVLVDPRSADEPGRAARTRGASHHGAACRGAHLCAAGPTVHGVTAGTARWAWRAGIR